MPRRADLLCRTPILFILSLNDRPELRALFAWATIDAVETTYHIAGGTKSKRVQELIITGRVVSDRAVRGWIETLRVR